MSEKKGFFAKLFGGGKSDSCCSMEIVEEESGCCCGAGSIQETSVSESEQEDILILEPDCKNC